MLKESSVERELRVREKWEKDGTFERSISNREGRETYVFYEGPPTANGLPHAGHALGRTIKDFVARYKTMSGYQVLRKAGWDTHGLPVELEVEKQLNIRGKDQIEEYGIENFIQKCKESVFAYENEWKQFTEALGYWVDMEDPYVTLNNEYIESVWNILSTIHEKGYLYKGHRVVPYCPHCETSLSSHEVAQGYKDVTDLSVTAKFRLKGTSNEYLLGWTTTPWTLPGNVAVAVNPNMNYVRVRQVSEIFVLAESLASTVMKEDYEILEVMKGKDLIGLSYEPPFNYVAVTNGHKVLGADFVTDTSGTGIVHIAPAHGEDDYKAIQDNQFDYVNVVDSKGRYKEYVAPLAGQFVKKSDVEIIKMLSKQNLLFDKQKYEHSYPHCWRCDSPLLYYAMEGWFIKTTAVKENMQSNNQGVEWFPSHMKDGRFGNFLDNMVDWNIGRNRYWGTPLNVWICQDCSKEKAPHSVKELRELSIEELPEDIELHKPYVDKVHLTCSCGGTMVRTSEVIDVWFDSGSMPFAQYHYPFENKDMFKKQFPAEVVIEGVDQTRGWFYSLLAVSTLFTGQSPYKRVLSLGHILDENGQKMSKSKGNALNPTELINEFGADSLRWALLADSSPWNNKRFSKKTVSHAKSKVIDTLLNVYSFYSMYAEIDQFNPDSDMGGTRTTLDKWVLSRLNTVIREVVQSLDDYDITKGARSIATFVDELSNWYVRRSRQRFWSSGMTDDKRSAFSTLFEVLKKLTQLMAPYTPFVSEDIYSNLVNNSVHVSDYPQPDETHIDKQLEKDMDAVLQIIELTRSLRNTVAIKTKQPLAQLVVVPTEETTLSQLQKYVSIIKDEMNIKEVMFKNDYQDLLQVDFKLNFSVVGPKLGKSVGEVKNKVDELDDNEKEKFLENREIQLLLNSGETITLNSDDILIEKKGKNGFELLEGSKFIALLDTNLTQELKEEGLVREFVRAVQTYRKELNLPVELRVDLFVQTDLQLQKVLIKFDELVQKNLIINAVHFESKPGMRSFKVEGNEVKLFIKS
ncbi:mupirocin-resistant isoleucine--tRNA ligase MupA [Paraliobacillus ryukyuensis]|uniref:Isoleucine--tRNA ligase n=1 Tax=Paraliobacillus ryukyuensis TaxID=200904 RepID=A0A366DZ11_9BACI|nr:isoleucine--tRNA ligase [Paraliobacillus ryukyuensis]RBO95277.1 isoleucyl-tRNA synthetase [Paraliobacillus ryukyuensis]